MGNIQTGDLGEFLYERQTKAVRALTSIPEPKFIADPDGCVDRIHEEYALDELAVSDIDGVESVAGFQEAKVAVYDSFERKAYQVDGIQVEIRIPFTGPGELWRHRASQFFNAGAYSDVELRDDHFLFAMGGHDLDANEVRAVLTRPIEHLQKTAGWINHDTRVWSSGLREVLEAIARDRGKRLGRAAALDQALGIPVAPTAPEKQIPIPVKRRPLHRAAPPTSASRGSRPPAQHRVLQDDVYQDVLRTIEQMGRAMEHTPTAA